MNFASFKIPDKLYRFIRLDSQEQRGWFSEIIRCCRFYGPTPNDFNDPFDCQLPNLFPQSIDFRFTKELVKECVASGGSPIHSLDQIRQNSTTDSEILSAIKEEIQRNINKSGVLCFSDKADHVLMWTHYASNHRGICVEIDSTKWETLKVFLNPVKYTNDRPVININKAAFDKREFAKSCAFTKHPDWSYEREWRLLDPWGGEKYFSFPKECLTGIIFGCRTSDSVKTFIKQEIEQSCCTPEYFQAEEDGNRYKLNIRALQSD